MYIMVNTIKLCNKRTRTFLSSDQLLIHLYVLPLLALSKLELTAQYIHLNGYLAFIEILLKFYKSYF